MRVLVALEHRFQRTPDGKVWTQVAFGYSFWQRYLEVFDGVDILARCRDVDSVPEGWVRVDGEGVALIPVPHYVGPWQYLLRAIPVHRAVERALRVPEAVILRVPSRVGSIAWAVISRSRRPYGVEVVGDPHDLFAPGSVHHPLRPLFRWIYTRHLRAQCSQACCASYVTEGALQQRYHPNPDAFATYYSDVELPPEAFATSPRTTFGKSPLRIVFVGTLQQLYKRPDVLIEAVAICVGRGLDLQLTIVGDGQHREQLTEQTIKRGIAGRVTFVGQLPQGHAVRRQFDEADLYVLPSSQEGLPRAMIEAMARGLPCIGTTVGGIPELLTKDDLVPPGDAVALADKIEEVMGSPERMVTMSRRNLSKARDYEEAALRKRRVGFYRYLYEITQRWIAVRNDPL